MGDGLGPSFDQLPVIFDPGMSKRDLSRGPGDPPPRVMIIANFICEILCIASFHKLPSKPGALNSETSAGVSPNPHLWGSLKGPLP